MIACIDVGYDDANQRAHVACVTLEDWADDQPTDECVVDLDHVQPYQPGSFYKRELPCVLAVIEALPRQPDVIVIDGYVWLDEFGSKGLGGHLYDALDQSCIVVGVAKTKFATATAIEVYRGQSERPLYVTAVGITPQRAAQHIQNMHGDHRLPTLLKRVDQLSRE